MKITTQWLSAKTFVSANENGNSIVMDGTPAAEGWKRGASPLEVLLMGVSGCCSVDVVGALKHHAGFVGCTTTVEADRAETIPRVFTRIHIRFQIAGSGIPPEEAQRAVAESLEKYCSACIMMGKAAPISHSVEIVAPEAA